MAPDLAERIEADAWRRFQDRLSRGVPGGTPIDELPDHIKAVLVEL